MLFSKPAPLGGKICQVDEEYTWQARLCFYAGVQFFEEVHHLKSMSNVRYVHFSRLFAHRLDEKCQSFFTVLEYVYKSIFILLSLSDLVSSFQSLIRYLCIRRHEVVDIRSVYNDKWKVDKSCSCKIALFNNDAGSFTKLRAKRSRPTFGTAKVAEALIETSQSKLKGSLLVGCACSKVLQPLRETILQRVLRGLLGSEAGEWLTTVLLLIVVMGSGAEDCRKANRADNDEELTVHA